MLRTYARCGPERDPRSLHMIDAHGKPTVYDLRSDIERQLAATAKTGLALLAVERCDGDGFIGCCGLIVGRASWDEPEIAFEMFRRAHGHGYATEAARRSWLRQLRQDAHISGRLSEPGTGHRCGCWRSCDLCKVGRSHLTLNGVILCGWPTTWLPGTFRPHWPVERSEVTQRHGARKRVGERERHHLRLLSVRLTRS
jgi:Acetyltransferase (GNAT) domain